MSSGGGGQLCLRWLLSEVAARVVVMSAVVVVTGANRGLGLASTNRLLREYNAVVVMCGRNGASLLTVAQDVAGKHSLSGDAVLDARDARLAASPPMVNAVTRIIVAQLDVSCSESVSNGAADVQAVLGGRPIDALLNNAGVALDLPWHEGPPAADAARRTLAVNYFGVQRCTEAFLPLLRESGGFLLWNTMQCVTD